MKLCIICKILKNEAEFNEEHIIPEFIGGGLVFDQVCATCNAKMGGSFEARLANIFLIKAPRFIHGIAGKTQAPNPFRGTFKTENESKIRINDKGESYLLPTIGDFIETPNGLQINFSVDEKDLHKTPGMIKKKLARYLDAKGESYTTEDIDRRVENSMSTRKLSTEVINNPIIKMSESFNFCDWHLLFMKIAYETASYHFSDVYLNDSKGELLRLDLFNQKPLDAIRNELFIPPEEDIIGGQLSKDFHWVILVGNMCYMRLFDQYAQCIEYAENIHPYRQAFHAYRYCFKTQKVVSIHGKDVLRIPEGCK